MLKLTNETFYRLYKIAQILNTNTSPQIDGVIHFNKENRCAYITNGTILVKYPLLGTTIEQDQTLIVADLSTIKKPNKSIEDNPTTIDFTTQTIGTQNAVYMFRHYHREYVRANTLETILTGKVEPIETFHLLGSVLSDAVKITNLFKGAKIQWRCKGELKPHLLRVLGVSVDIAVMPFRPGKTI
jgi:hypothetical protein